MLSKTEIKQLNNREIIKPRERANLYYRIAQKIKSNLSELVEIDQVLRSIPPKNAKRALDDEIVASMFKLTENVLKILGYAPIMEDPMGGRSIIRSEEIISRSPKSEEMKVIRKSPTDEDEARQMLLKHHIDNLQRFANPEFQTRPGFLYRPGPDAYRLYNKWQGND
jgi:hypothetical protein